MNKHTERAASETVLGVCFIAVEFFGALGFIYAVWGLGRLLGFPE